MRQIPSTDITCIFGPTASGKTAFAIHLAQECNGVIINADSMQIYKDLRDLTARPSAEEEAQAPHKLFGILNADDPCNAVRWSRLAKAEINTCLAQGQHPILVGGTGLYFRALLEGLSPIPEVCPTIDKAVRFMPVERLDQVLAITGETALADPQRKMRAVSVYLSSGKPLRFWQGIKPEPLVLSHRFLILWPDRDAVYRKIERRFESMIRDGNALDEIRHLLSLNAPADVPLRRAIGAPEIVAYLEGQATLDQAIAAAQQSTRRYAKRQFTWMRAERDKRLGDANFEIISV